MMKLGSDGQMFKSVHKIARAGQSKAFSEALVKGQKESNLCPRQGQAQQGTVWGWA